MIKFSFLTFFLISVLAGSAQGNSYKQSSNRVAQPSKDHYKTIGALSAKPVAAYAWMDTIVYPAKEVATGTLAATMMRTAYLIEDVPSLLNIQPLYF